MQYADVNWILVLRRAAQLAEEFQEKKWLQEINSGNFLFNCTSKLQGEGGCMERGGSLKVFVGRSLCSNSVFHEFTCTGPGWFRSPLGAKAPCLGLSCLCQWAASHMSWYSSNLLILFAEGRNFTPLQENKSLSSCLVTTKLKHNLNNNKNTVSWGLPWGSHAMQAAECFVQLFTNLVTYLKPALSETSSPGTFSLHFSSNNSCSLWAVCLV